MSIHTRIIVLNVHTITRGHMPNTSKTSVGGRKWRSYLAQSARQVRSVLRSN